MTLDPARPSWEKIRAATKELLTENPGGSWGDFKSNVARQLNVPVDCLKPWKAKMKQVVAEGVKEGHSSDEEEDEGCSEQSNGEESGEDDSTERSSSKAGVSKEEESAAMAALKRMVKAMNLGPKPFQGLKSMNRREAEKELKNRLLDAGAEFKGPFPSSKEIEQAQRKTDKAKDLEGIDLENVVQGSRRRGRPDNISLPKKKRRRVDAQVGSSDNEGSQGTGSGGSEHSSSDNEDSEVEFELSG